MTEDIQNIKTISAEHNGQRFERWVKKTFPHLAYGMVQKLIRTGQFRVDGKRCKADTILAEGQAVRFPPSLSNPNHMPQKREKPLSDEDIKFIRHMVLYDDQHLLAFNKPHGLAVQGGSKTTRHIDQYLPAFIDKKTGIKPRLLHRIDKDTSGLLLCGKTNKYTKFIMQSFKKKTINKAYIALCSPAPDDLSGKIIAPLSKTKISGQERMAIDDEEGDYAETHYQVIDQLGKDAALVCFMPVTGRTHQIRVHAEYSGFPIIGDPKYHKVISHDPNVSVEELQTKRDSITAMLSYTGLHLHAHAIQLPNQTAKADITELVAPLSADMKKSLKILGLTLPKWDDLSLLIGFTKL